MFSFPRPSVMRFPSSSLMSRTPVECCIRLVISSCSESSWISKDHDEGAFLPPGCGLALAFDSAVARENGRRTVFLVAGSKRCFATERRREDGGLLDLSWGDRPAGLRMGLLWAEAGADLGVDGDALRVMEAQGVEGWSMEAKAVREDLIGLGDSLSDSSSSESRFRLVERLRVEGLMFSVSISAIGRLL